MPTYTGTQTQTTHSVRLLYRLDNRPLVRQAATQLCVRYTLYDTAHYSQVIVHLLPADTHNAAATAGLGYADYLLLCSYTQSKLDLDPTVVVTYNRTTHCIVRFSRNLLTTL